MANLAVHLALLHQPAHQRVAELRRLIGMTGEADFHSDRGRRHRLDGRSWLGGFRALCRRRLRRRGRVGLFIEELA